MAGVTEVGAPILSVVVPARNKTSGLKESLAGCIPELVNQVEWIIIDDASEPPVDRESLQTSQHLRIIRCEERVGAANARNIGIDASNGDYIWFVDADDLVSPMAFPELLPILKTRVHDLVIFPYYLEKETVILKEMSLRDNRAWEEMNQTGDTGKAVKMTTYPWNRVIRKRLIENNGIRFLATEVFTDIFFVWMVTARARSVYLYPRALYIYRQIPSAERLGSINDSRRLQFFIQVLYLFRVLKNDRTQVREIIHRVWERNNLIHKLPDSSARNRFLEYSRLLLKRIRETHPDLMPLRVRICISSRIGFRIRGYIVSFSRLRLAGIRKTVVAFIWKI